MLRLLMALGALSVLSWVEAQETTPAPRPYGIVAPLDNADHVDPMVAHDEQPFYPSRLSTAGRALTPDLFDPPEVCAGCHADIYAQWNGSMHSLAWKDPVYRALLDRASAATGGQVDNFCMGCHTPIGTVTRSASPADAEGTNPLADAGVQCDFCHNVSGATGIGNGSLVVTPRRDGRPLKFGPFDDALSPYHDTAYSPLHTTSALCGNCHNVTHPFNNLPVERTYDEWRDSEYAAKGIDCQDCHMTPGPGISQNPGTAATGAPQREHIWSHWFIGGNAVVTRALGAERHAQQAEEMLQSAATLEFLGQPEVRRGVGTVRLRVTNTGAGHKLPTGFPEGREMWVDFQVTDALGRRVYRSGAVQDGWTEPGTHSFRVKVANAAGKILHYELWEATRVVSDTRLNPKAFADLEYRFRIPRKARLPLKIRADLNYWSFPPGLLKELMGDQAPAVPIIRMTGAELELGNGSARRGHGPELAERNRVHAAGRH